MTWTTTTTILMMQMLMHKARDVFADDIALIQGNVNL